MRTAYWDCFSGVSGDMAAGALIDAGADIDALRTGLQSLGVPGLSVDAERIAKRGIAATKFHVRIDASVVQPHRHLHNIQAMIRAGELPEAVKVAAIDTFRLLAEAEAAVHGTTPEKVHFHEVGAVDSIADIVAVQHALHLLGIERCICSPLPTGHGMVRCEHGLMPIPAPATAKLLEGRPTYGGDVEGEMVTPTGAALMVQRVHTFGPQPPMAVRSIGYGAGTREYADRSNVVRVLVGDMDEMPAATESVTVLEANIDDMNPELLPVLIEALMQGGARDAFCAPVTGKKGRVAHCVTVLCDAGSVHALSAVMFAHSTTLGLRFRREERIVLERAWREVATAWGTVKVKLAYWNGQQNTVAPEFEECRSRAEAAGVPVRSVYEKALAAALKGEFLDA